MAIAKTTFLAQDGKEFKTEVQADAHDLFKSVEPRIEAYIEEAGLKKAQAGSARNIISGYLAFVIKNFKPSTHLGDIPVAEVATAADLVQEEITA